MGISQAEMEKAGWTLCREERESRVGKRPPVRVLHEFYRDRKGEEHFTPAQSRRIRERAGEVIREREQLLRPKEVRDVRKSLKLNQPEMESLLGVGPKTVTRWERGTVFQSKAVDTLLRVLREVPAAREWLLESRQLGPAYVIPDVAEEWVRNETPEAGDGKPLDVPSVSSAAPSWSVDVVDDNLCPA